MGGVFGDSNWFGRWMRDASAMPKLPRAPCIIMREQTRPARTASLRSQSSSPVPGVKLVDFS